LIVKQKHPLVQRDSRQQDLKALGKVLREKRIGRNLTLELLGKLVGKSASTLSKIESGHQSLDMGTFLDLMEKLEASPSGVLLDLQLSKAESAPHREAIQLLRKMMMAIET
jgi:transcriptional regulator with XRE-family HTH domain